MADKTSRNSKVAKKVASRRAGAKPARLRKTPSASQVRNAAKPTLLSGGNPQIAKGYGNAPVEAYLAAMPGWKGDVGRRLDAIIMDAVPDVHKAIKWNTPFYGLEGQGW